MAKKKSARTPGRGRLVAAICAALVIATLAVYWQTAQHGFIAYDDDQYVYENPQVLAGLSASGIVWAWTTFFYANWHPLTWMSLMLDAQLFGPGAAGFHVTNMLLHIVAAIFLLLALARMTGCVWRSAVVAGIFALHPLHVESVAWVSERKDVLSTALAMVALFLYVRYVERPGARRYLWVAMAYALSLAAKPMLVTFPFVLLLLDFWPLRRTGWQRLLLEKAPLLAMAAVTSVLTYMAQHAYGAVATLSSFPLPARIANAAIAYVTYLEKAFWPAGLGVLYPVEPPDPATAWVCVLLLAGVTAVTVLTIRVRPYLAVAWFWYVGTLVPVIGLVQVGLQANADRYTYLPLVGFSIALVWSIADYTARHARLQQAAAWTAGAVLLLFAIAAHMQAAYWIDSRTLFQHTLAVTRHNHVILNNLGVILASDGKHEEAIEDYRQAIAIDPAYAEARANLGHELMRTGHLDEAYPALTEAVRLKPDSSAARGDLGVMLAARGNFVEARQNLEESLRLQPGNAEMQSNLCYVLQRLNRLEDAVQHCDEALRLKPDFNDAHFNRGTALAAMGNAAGATAEFRAILAADPNRADARAALAALPH